MINWISKELGTGAFEKVRTLPDIEKVDVRDLVDKKGNDSELILEKINTAVALIDSGKKVVICCDYGISRSNAIAAAILAITGNITFDDAVEKVFSVLGRQEIKLSVIHSVRKAIQTGTKYNQDNKLLIALSNHNFLRAFQKNMGMYLDVNIIDKGIISMFDSSALLDIYVNRNNINTIVFSLFSANTGTNAAFGKSLNWVRNVLDVVIENKIKLVFLSDVTVFNGYKKSIDANEEYKTLTNTTFADTKAFSELLIKNYAQIYNFQYLIIRTGIMYGDKEAKEPRFLSNFIHTFRSGNIPEITLHKYINEYPALDMVHVNDVSSALCELLDKDLTGTFNIGADKLYYIKDIVKFLVQKYKMKTRIKFSDINDYIFNAKLSNDKLKQYCKWKPTLLYDFLDKLD